METVKEREVSTVPTKADELGNRAEKLVLKMRVWFWRSASMKKEAESRPAVKLVREELRLSREALGVSRKDSQSR